MSAADQDILVDFINSGKGVYLEGTNIAVDHGTTPFWDLFGASYIGTGPDGGDIISLSGNGETFAEGMSFNYSSYGEYPNARVNRLSASDGVALFDSENGFTRVVHNDTGAGKVIASTIIFGALYDQDIVSTRNNLMATYLSYILNREAPTVWISNESIDFGTNIPGAETTLNLYVRNLGLNMLTLSDIQISSTNFNLLALDSYDLDFGQMVELPIVFPCDIEGEFSEQITITTNDTANPTINIDVTGSCYSLPQMDVDVTQFDLSVGTGNSMETQFNIANIGGGYLDYFIETLNINRGSGGPDNYGYTWVDSNNPDGPEYQWFDISSIGTASDLSGVDNYIEVEIPMLFPFYGELKELVKISTNGYITFGNDPVDHSNDPIPFSMDPNDFIAALWDDLRTGDESVLYTYFDAEIQRYIIQYQDWKFYTGGGTGDLDFQIQLYPNGDIYFFYDNLEGNLVSASVGVENQDSSDGLQVAYNEQYLENQLAVKISPNPVWLVLDEYSGSVFQGVPHTLTLNINAATLSEGNYSALIKIHGSDNDHGSVDIPVELTVTATSSGEDLPAIPQLGQNYPNPFNPLTAGRGPTTIINYSISNDNTPIKLVVFNMKGQQIVELVNDILDRGNYNVSWDGRDAYGNSVSSGMYFYKLETERYSQTKKMILMK